VARQQVGDGMLIGASTHNLSELERAVAEGAGFVTFGPVYPTPSKARYGPALGVDALREAFRRSSVPVFGLGGITAARRREVLGTGAAGVALISVVLGADDPCGAAAEFRS